MKRIPLLILIALHACFAMAQDVVTDTTSMAQNGLMDIPETLQTDMDSMYIDWQTKHLLSMGDSCNVAQDPVLCSDSIYIDRLKRIPTDMRMVYNEEVKAYIERYATRLRHKVAFMLGAYNFYAPIIEEAIDLYELPHEFKYLPVIESALNPKARSRRGAVGMWQFIMSTGKRYGLENSTLVDERCDPAKASFAAARMLSDLYAIYKDWDLVLAAYNCGPGNVNKAIKRSGGSTDYWTIYDNLPRETRGYVPAFIAAIYIMNYYCEHGICPMECELPAATDTLTITKDLHLQQVADVCRVDIDQLRCLNPQYKKDIVPGYSAPHSLRLPTMTAVSFIELEDTIFKHRADELLNKRFMNNYSCTQANVAKGSSGAQYHKIRSGDTLGALARKYHTTVRKIQQMNGLRGTQVRVGRRIRVK